MVSGREVFVDGYGHGGGHVDGENECRCAKHKLQEA